MLGNLHKRSTRSLSALADDFDSLHKRNEEKYRSFSLGLRLTNSSVKGPLQGNGNGLANSGAFDPFVSASTPLSAGAVGPVSGNPYSHDPTAALAGGAFFANQGGFQQPVCAAAQLPIENALQTFSPLTSIAGPIPSLCPHWPS
jgi:hypothetical protein